MKQFSRLFILSFALFSIGLFSTSCTTKTGCKINENAHVKPNKKGKYKKSKTKSGLFPKEMKKKKKSRK